MSAEFSHPFSPNIAIQLADITELPEFEDTVAELIDPRMSDAQRLAWDARSSIKDLIRPTKFNGRITEVELLPLDNPYAKLLTAREDGWRIPKHRFGGDTEANFELKASRCLGFYLTANAKSSGRGTIGQVQAGLWYFPVGMQGVGNHQSRKSQSHGGRSVVRINTEPIIETKKFIGLERDSARIALDALRKAMQSPLRIGLHN